MNRKYHEFAGKFLPVVSVSGIVAILIRLKLMDGKPDAFFFNVIFVLMLVFFITMYSHFVLLGEEIIELVTRLFRGKNKNKKQLKEEEKLITEKKDNEMSTEIATDQLRIPESVNIDPIRKAQHQQKLQQESDKLNIGLDYIRSQFALYASDEEIQALCNVVGLFSKKEEIPNHISIHTKELTNLDLYHFGWNIWNHFRPIKQEEVSKLLKIVFVSLADIDLESIKSHLKDDPKKGIIKILENLADYQKI
jgi:hypothetical protein